jgi:hypothetical protein
MNYFLGFSKLLLFFQGILFYVFNSKKVIILLFYFISVELRLLEVTLIYNHFLSVLKNSKCVCKGGGRNLVERVIIGFKSIN